MKSLWNLADVEVAATDQPIALHTCDVSLSVDTGTSNLNPNAEAQKLDLNIPSWDDLSTQARPELWYWRWRKVICVRYTPKNEGYPRNNGHWKTTFLFQGFMASGDSAQCWIETDHFFVTSILQSASRRHKKPSRRDHHKCLSLSRQPGFEHPVFRPDP